MRFKTTWILLILAAVFLGYYFLVEEPQHKKKLAEEERAQKLTFLKSEDIVHLSIARKDGEELEFQKDGESWRMLSPIPDIAERATINSLIGVTVDAEIERRIQPEDVDLSDCGLEEPEARITFSTSRGDTVMELTVGNHNLTKSHCYARKDTSREILLLPAGIRRYAMKDLSDFRDKKVIDFGVDDVIKFEITSSSRTLVLEKDSRNDWITVEEGDTTKGDKNGIEAILRQLRGLRVKKFISDNPEDLGKYTQEGKKTITLWIGEDRSKKALILGDKEEEGCYAKRDSKNRIVLLDPGILDVFDKTAEDLRDRHLLHFDRGTIARIQLETPDTTASILKEGSDWAFGNPALGSVVQYRVSSLLYRLENLKFDSVQEERFTRREGYGLDNPSFKVTLRDSDGHIIDEVLCGHKLRDSDEKYVTSRSSAILASIGEEALKKLLDSFHNLRKK